MNLPFSLLHSFALLSLYCLTTAQTWTSCNPLNNDHCPANTALSTNTTSNFTTAIADPVLWKTTSGALKYDADNGALFTIARKGDSPTIQSNFYIFFGVVSVVMRAATGRGVVSSIVLESDDLDEVDWEFLGADNAHVESNYFGKGNTTSYDRAIYHPVADPQELFHNYTIIWTVNKLEWLIDGATVRTLLYNEALGGKNYPQTPMNVRLGIWGGGNESNKQGTIEWAGGMVDYKEGPYTMMVRSVYVQDFSTGKGYAYGDRSGSWQSIKLANGTSPIAAHLSSPHTASQHWRALSNGARIGITCTVLVLAAGALALLAFCCVKQRRAGRYQKAVADAEYEKDTAALIDFRMEEIERGSRGRSGWI